MATKAMSSTAIFIFFNLLFFTLVSSNYVPCPPPPRPVKPHPHKPSKFCPIDTLKLGACANLLNDLVHIIVGTPPKTPCCSLIENLADIEAAVCLCTAIKANILGINLNVSISLTALLNYCGKGIPDGYKCA